MNYDYRIPTLLLRFLSTCIYGEIKAYYFSLSETELAKLEKQGEKFGLTAWFYRYLYDILPKTKRDEYQKNYQVHQAKVMLGALELKRFYRILSAHGLRFVPIKGADLVYRLYPDTALRSFVDWDIWFHPDDIERALAVLAEDGWRIPEFYSDANEAAFKTAEHHFSPHVRGRNMIEPHFTLANFDDIDVYEMWEHTVDYPNGDGQRILSPEMNLLMLTRHAASQSYYHANIPKLLTDAAIIIRNENVDYEKLRNLAVRWHLPYPGDLLAAFPEFFPPDVIADFNADQKRTADFRRIFELRGKLGKPENVSLFLSRRKVKGKVLKGVLEIIRDHNPSMIRRIYRLPKHGAWERVLWGYISWFGTRSWRAVFSSLRWNPNLKKYASLVESLEEICPKGKQSPSSFWKANRHQFFLMIFLHCASIQIFSIDIISGFKFFQQREWELSLDDRFLFLRPARSEPCTVGRNTA